MVPHVDLVHGLQYDFGRGLGGSARFEEENECRMGHLEQTGAKGVV